MTSCLTSGPAPSHDASSLLRHRSSYPTASFTSLFSVAMLASLVLLAPLLISLTSPVYAEESTADEQQTTEETAPNRDGTESVLDFLPNSLAPVGTVFRMPLHSGALTEEARSELLSQLTILINVALEPYTLANTDAEGAESQANLLLSEEFESRPITRDGETFIIILPTVTKDSDSYEYAIYNLWLEVKGKFFDATQGHLAEDYNEEMGDVPFFGRNRSSSSPFDIKVLSFFP